MYRYTVCVRESGQAEREAETRSLERAAPRARKISASHRASLSFFADVNPHTSNFKHTTDDRLCPQHTVPTFALVGDSQGYDVLPFTARPTSSAPKPIRRVQDAFRREDVVLEDN